MSEERLTLWQAAYVVARRDFVAVLFSRAFIFFLLGPLFAIAITTAASGIGLQVAQETSRQDIGLAMQAEDVDAMLAAQGRLAPRLGGALPEMIVLQRLGPGEPFDPAAALERRKGHVSAILSGSPADPVLTGAGGQMERWAGPISLIAASALGREPEAYPPVRLTEIAASAASKRVGNIRTAQAGQMLLFLLTMLLCGMVISNLVEEKANKIIEILAAAIPMDAVFLGKLFAMLAVSLVGITVWGSVAGLLVLLGQHALPSLPTPGVGWPIFLALGIAYFAMAYLLLGSVFLAIGSLAATVREVQTLSMPITMMQLLVFFMASMALPHPGGAMELAAIAIPFSSPFAMLARAAMDGALWPHLAALAWQAFWVALFVRIGANLFRRRVMKSGPARGGKRGFGFAAPFRRGAKS